MTQGRRKPGKKLVYRKKRQNRLSMVLSLTVVAAIILAVSVRSVSLRKKLAEYNQNKEQLQEQIAAEEKRSEQIDQYADYVQTDEYVEEVAHDKLGLVKEGEIVFRKNGTESGTAGTGSTEEASAAESADESTQEDIVTQNSEEQEDTAVQDSQAQEDAAVQENGTQTDTVTQNSGEEADSAAQ